MKNFICLLSLLLFPVLLLAESHTTMRYKIASVSDNIWTDPTKREEVRRQIDRIAQDGFNVISIGTYKFMPLFFVDYSQTPYPEAEEFDAKRIVKNVQTFRENIQYAKSKGIRYVVSRSYSLYAPYQFWKAHQKELNPDSIYNPFLEKAHQNDIYRKTISSEKKGDVIPHQQWNNSTFRNFFLYSTGKMLEVIPELDGFLNAYAEAAWTLDPDKVRANEWNSWKECIDYEATNDNFLDYCNTLYDLLKQKREGDVFFGMRDWYVKPDVLKRLKMPREELVISVKYGGYDQPVVNYPPWGKDLQDEGYSVVLDMLVFDAEHPHPLYWYDKEIISSTFSNIYQGQFAGIAYQDYMTKGNDSPDNPIRLLTQKTVSSAMNQQPFTEKDAIAFLQPYYGQGSENIIKSLKNVSTAQSEFIKLLPSWFWQGDGLTPGGLQAYRFWMLIDHPESPVGMDFIRQDAVGIKEYAEAVISGSAGFEQAQAEWKSERRKTPVQIMQEMEKVADLAVKYILEARNISPEQSPYMQDMVASAVIHQQLVLRQIAFLKASLAYYESGYSYDDKYNKSDHRVDTGIDKRQECSRELSNVIYYDKMLAELCRRYAPRRPERRGVKDYLFERKIARVMEEELVVLEVNEEELRRLEGIILK